MDYYLTVILMGVIMVALSVWLLPNEEQRRKEHYRRCFNTVLKIQGTKIARKLRCSYYIIGRRERRCDLRLKDASVSKVHAVLRYTDSGFHIAPCRDTEFLMFGIDTEELPKVYVNGEEIPETGVVLEMGDVVRLGNTRFTLENRF